MSGKTAKQIKEEIYDKIREYYLKSKNYLDSDNYKMAHNTLYIEMPQSLYDLSLDLWANRNMDKDLTEEQVELISLINEVDYKLNSNNNDEDF